MTIVTTEIVALQGARAATVAEASSRAGTYLAAVSAGLVAIALVGQATTFQTAFFVVALVILTTLLWVGLVSFARTSQSSVEDYGYALRVARARQFYFDAEPSLGRYLQTADADQTVRGLGLRSSRGQALLTFAGMISVVNSVLAGSVVGLAFNAADRGAVSTPVLAGGAAAVAAFAAQTAYQMRAWQSRTPGDGE